MRYSILVFLFTLLFSQSVKAATKRNVSNSSFEIKRANGEVASYCGNQSAAWNKKTIPAENVKCLYKVTDKWSI